MKIREYLSNYKTILKLEKEIDKKELLRFEKVYTGKSLPENLSDFTLNDFIYKWLDEWSYYFCTVEIDGEYQTLSRRRSLIDIYRICKFYKQDVRLYDIWKAVGHLIKTRKLYTFFCLDIQRQVYMNLSYFLPSYYVKYWQKDDLNLDILSSFKIIQLTNAKR